MGRGAQPVYDHDLRSLDSRRGPPGVSLGARVPGPHQTLLSPFRWRET